MSAPYNVKQALLAAYRHLLTPLVRVLLRNGISYLEFAEVARQVFVDVAGRDFSLPKRKISLSRIAIMTGLSRKEAARLAREKGAITRIVQDAELSRVGSVLQGWYTDSEFTGPYGVPLDLKFDDAPRKPSFTELVRRYSGDMPARAMLDELLRVGAARLEGETGLIRVLSRAYIPEKLAAESVRHFGMTARDFIDTLDVNLRKAGPGKGRFERRVVSSEGMRVSDLAEFDLFVRDRGQQFLVEVDDWISARSPPDVSEARAHAGIGVYLYLRNESEDRALEMVFEGESNAGDLDTPVSED
ncbi:MAG: DUF6502 family protein [Phycisphaerales bacterium]|nr:DUF6502 family protein [Phycisphaerales bacterium]